MERIKFNLEIPQDIKLIHKIFKDNGFKLFIVGGSIRDALLGKTPKDWDLATDAIPDKVESMMGENGLRTIATGKAFGVINVFTDTDEFEIATFRTDVGSGRRPDSVIFTTIEGDVLRRDLTINALFFDLDTSEVVDLVGGIEDLKNGIIRTVGNAEDRFNEDRLRILRAIRFAARFSNGLHSGIIDALNKDSRLGGFPITTHFDGSTSSNNISAERIRDEFLKGLKSANSTIFFLEMLDSFNLFDWILPNMVVNKKFIEDKDPIIQLATLLKNHKWGSLIKDLNKLTFTSVEIKAIEFLTALHKLDVESAVIFKRIFKFSGVSSDQLRNFGSREGISSQLLDAFEEFELTVNGDEVMKEFNLKPSKELGDKIRELETNNFKKLLGIS
jgi:tRNA nucleotidyltransferase/poly(A) polymerase